MYVIMSVEFIKGDGSCIKFYGTVRLSVCFYRATAKHTHGIAVEILSVRPSVCLSVCPSVKRVYFDKTKAPSEKKSSMTNRKSSTSSPMSPRGTSYVAPNPQRGLKAIFFHFPHKRMGFSRRKSAAKFLCVKTFSSKVVRHSLAYSSVHNWLVGDPDVPFDLKYWAKVTHPSKKATSNRYLPVL